MSSLKKLIREVHRRSLWQVLGIYIVGSWIALQVVDVLANNFGLPPWFPAFALALLVIGLPIVLATSFVQEGVGGKASASDLAAGDVGGGEQADAAGTASVPSWLPAHRRLLTWRNAIVGGLAALALWGVVATGWLFLGPRPGAEVVEAAVGVTETPAADLRSIAVLPFSSVHTDEQSLAFTAGVHDDLLTQLSKIGSLTVISRTSVMKYRDTELGIPEIAKELGVATVLEGRVQRSGDRVRVNVQLIEAKNDRHLWAETYDAELTAANIFAIQTDMAQEIAGALRATLAPDVTARMEARPTESLEAYDLYALGLYTFENQGTTREGLEKAIELFERAIAADSGYARAWARLADMYAWLWTDGYLTPAEAEPRIRAAAERALALDPNLAEGHAAYAYVLEGALRWEDAERALERAIELNPGSAETRRRYAALLSRRGRAQESLAHLRRAAELDPLSLRIRLNLAISLLLGLRDEQGALSELQTILELEPDNENALYWAGIAYVLKGEIDEGINLLRTTTELDPADPYNKSALAWAYARGGQREAALALVKEVPERGGDLLKEIALVYGELGERDTAFEYLDRALAADSSSVRGLGNDAMADSLRVDPRFQKYLRIAGLE